MGIRVVILGQPFRKVPFPKVKKTHAALTPDGALLIGIPGDGDDPSTWAQLARSWGLTKTDDAVICFTASVTTLS